MAHEDEAERTRQMESSERTRESSEHSARRPRRDAAKVRAQTIGLIADVIRWVGLLFAVVLVVYIILTIGGANPHNGITTFVGNWADSVSLGFKDLFTPDDANLRVLVNYGIAAIFWLVVTQVIAKLLRRAA